MNDSHDHPHHDPDRGGKPDHGPANPARLEGAEDSGVQALSDALRSSFAIVKVIMVGLLVLFLFSGFFVVGPQEKALVLRFGIPVGGGDGQLLGPGPHWAFPPPIDSTGIVNFVRAKPEKSRAACWNETKYAHAARMRPGRA